MRALVIVLLGMITVLALMIVAGVAWATWAGMFTLTDGQAFLLGLGAAIAIALIFVTVFASIVAYTD